MALRKTSDEIRGIVGEISAKEIISTINYINDNKQKIKNINFKTAGTSYFILNNE